MSLLETIYGLIARSFKYRPVKKIKNILRPVKHFLLGKDGIYRAIDIVKEQNGGDDILVVFDIGAAVGDTAVTLLKAFPRADVYCFEPLLESFLVLKKQTASFGNRVHLFNFALSDKNGEEQFYVHPHRDSSSFVRQADGILNVVKTRRLDDTVRELGIKKIDFMKVDVEGWENEVIQGGLDTLKNKVHNLFIEINPIYYRGERRNGYIRALDAIFQCGFYCVGIFGDFLFTKAK